MSGAHWVGVDLGTQSVRAVVVDDHGATVGAGSAALTSVRADGRHEQDPEHWWRAVCAALRSALSAVPAGTIGAVAVDGTSGTILLAGRDGRPLTPGLMYDDGRAGAEAAEVNDLGRAVWAGLGYRSMQPSWALPKLAWLYRHDPGLRRPGVRLLHQTDLVTWRLAGRQLPTDASNALKTGVDLVGLGWPEDVVDGLGIPVGVLPEVVVPGSVIGTVGAEAAELTGLPSGTPVVAGMTDGCASQLGAGALSVGSWNSVLGTTLVLKGVSPWLVDDPLGVVYCHRGPADGVWLPGGASSSGAGVIGRDFPGADIDALTATASERSPRAVSYPLVSGAGERFPFRAPGAEPFTLGEVGDDVDAFAALLLGVACVERLCLDYLDLIGVPTGGELRVTGGGSRNAFWCRLRSDLLGRELIRPRDAEAAHGMALLASTTSGRPLTESAAAMVVVDERYPPDSRRAAELTGHYLALVDELSRRGWLDRSLADHARRGAQR